MPDLRQGLSSFQAAGTVSKHLIFKGFSALATPLYNQGNEVPGESRDY